MERYYPLRRVPESVSTRVLWGHLRGIVGPLARSVGASLRVAVPLPRDPLARDRAKSRARQTGGQVFEELQHIYFENPGLDTLTVRVLAKFGRDLAYLDSFIWRAQRALRIRPQVAQDRLRKLPRSGYDSLIVGGLTAGKALGMFRGGRTSTKLWWDSAQPEQKVQFEAGHKRPRVRRFDPPRSLGDLAADIDDLYWADAYGQSLKVTRVGSGANRRWLVSLPGTDHTGLETEPNPADIEANLREELNLPNAMRRGTVEAIRLAMLTDGVPAEQIPSERVLICGHSQGGMVAVALAAAPPEKAGINVDRVLTLGSPTRRLRLRDDVVALAVEHDQDVVPSFDATPRVDRDQRVTVQRKLNSPRLNPLFYAHSSSTYTETVRRLERRNAVAPWGRESDAVRSLQGYLPGDEDETRVFHLYVWQQVREAGDRHPWTDLFNADLPEYWEPVRYEGEITVAPAPEQSVSDRLAVLIEQFRPGAHTHPPESEAEAEGPDAVTEDTGAPDVGEANADTPETETPDAGTPDAGTPGVGTSGVGAAPDQGGTKQTFLNNH